MVRQLLTAGSTKGGLWHESRARLRIRLSEPKQDALGAVPGKTALLKILRLDIHPQLGLDGLLLSSHSALEVGGFFCSKTPKSIMGHFVAVMCRRD